MEDAVVDVEAEGDVDSRNAGSGEEPVLAGSTATTKSPPLIVVVAPVVNDAERQPGVNFPADADDARAPPPPPPTVVAALLPLGLDGVWQERGSGELCDGASSKRNMAFCFMR